MHSPVVGPSTWHWVAEALRAAGHDAKVPNLVATAVAGDPAALVERAAQRAAALGWPVVERPGGHLDIVNHGEEIGSILLGLVGVS